MGWAVRSGDARETESELGLAKRFRVSRVWMELQDAISPVGWGRWDQERPLPSFAAGILVPARYQHIINLKPQPQNRKPHRRQRKYRLNCGGSFCCCFLRCFSLPARRKTSIKPRFSSLTTARKRAASGSALDILVQRTNHALQSCFPPTDALVSITTTTQSYIVTLGTTHHPATARA